MGTLAQPLPPENKQYDLHHPQNRSQRQSKGDQPYMLNLRTPNLDALLASLKASGVNVIRREEMIYGKFAWIRDLDGNRLELFEATSEQ